MNEGEPINTNEGTSFCIIQFFDLPKGSFPAGFPDIADGAGDTCALGMISSSCRKGVKDFADGRFRGGIAEGAGESVGFCREICGVETNEGWDCVDQRP